MWAYRKGCGEERSGHFAANLQEDLQQGRVVEKDQINRKSPSLRNFNFCVSSMTGHVKQHVPLKETSVADGSRTAASMVLDGSDCQLARLMAKWGASDHGERCFQRLLAYT